MKSVFSLIASLALAATQVTAQTVYFCGDSTMARGNGVIDGWGQHIGKYLTVPAVNHAIGGRSARSFTNEGRFQAVANLVKSGDVVVIEFGHNDGGSPRSNDNGRSNCPGTGTETCISDTTGEIVYTYVFYVIQAAKLMLSKGATVILSSQTPRNQWETDTYNGEPSRYVGYQLIAKNALADSRVTFVDHFTAVSKMYLRRGPAGTRELYPVAGDRTHTGSLGADLSAQAWAQAIAQRLNGTTSLADRVRLPVPIVY